MTEIEFDTDYIKLDSFLKLSGLAETGGGAKNMITEGLVRVDGEPCFMRGKKLRGGEVVELNGKRLRAVRVTK